jgi:hypothetical protein
MWGKIYVEMKEGRSHGCTSSDAFGYVIMSFVSIWKYGECDSGKTHAISAPKNVTDMAGRSNNVEILKSWECVRFRLSWEVGSELL